MDNFDFKKYKEVLIELNKLNLQHTQVDSLSVAKFFDFKILKYANIDEIGVVKFDNKHSLIAILNRLHSNNLSKSTIERINEDCINMNIDSSDELYAKLHST